MLWRHTMTKANSHYIDSAPSLSLCMIVKNEQDYLKNCLESVVGLCDEIIIVDTGSTDDTLNIAKMYNAKIISSPWRNDFSQARNVSLESATCDWILVLDADEAISKSEHHKYKYLIANKEGIDGYKLNQLNYLEDSTIANWQPNNLTDAEAKGYPGYVISPLTRLFKRDPKIRFSGRVHEHVKCTKLANTNLNIHHYGKYKPKEYQESKEQKYLELGILKCKENPENDHFWYELGAQYMAFKKLDEAIDALERSLSINPKNSNALIALSSIFCKLGRTNEAEDIFEQMMKTDPTNYHIYAYYPNILAHNGNILKAEKIMQQGYKYACHQPSFHINYGFVAKNLGNPRKAIDHFLHALKINPNEATASYNLGLTYAEIGNYESSIEYFIKSSSSRDFAYWSYVQLSVISLITSNYQKAIEYADLARSISPSENEPLIYKTSAYIQLNEQNKAVQTLEQVCDSTLSEPQSLTIAKLWKSIGKEENSIKYQELYKNASQLEVL